ncbi:hypothetical protein [Haliangium sp.]|uniref:hypothetical protein n=1 Tax=Haliangium sp. TaxID=2663208 RepID=UPI003D0EB22B
MALAVAVHSNGSIETVGGNERGPRGLELDPGDAEHSPEARRPAVRRRCLTRAEWATRLYCIARTVFEQIRGSTAS